MRLKQQDNGGVYPSSRYFPETKTLNKNIKNLLQTVTTSYTYPIYVIRPHLIGRVIKKVPNKQSKHHQTVRRPRRAI